MTSRSVLYRKPAFPGRVATVRYPYTPALWRKHDCFDLSLLDGGAFFFSNDHLGCASGATTLRAWEDGSLLAPWKNGTTIDWDRFWVPLEAQPYQRRFEQHVWLNRLYCLLPLAQAWFRTGERRFARGWDRLLTDWLRTHPPVAPLRPSAESRYCWYDMQVTTRLIMLLHSVFLLSRGDALPAASWRRVYRAVRLHARHICAEARQAHATNSGLGNHYQQKGAALIAAGVLFPEFPEAAEWLETGRVVLAEHAAREILADGASVEASPSYSHFIARLCLDPHLLLLANGQEPLRGWEALLQRQYAYLARTCDPSGHTLQISDSYRMNAAADLALVHTLWPALGTTPRGGSGWFAASHFGMLRNRRFDVALDAGPTNLWHHHRGRPNVLLWRDGEPLLIDSGCPNYDEDVRERWCKTAAAHNVVTVEPLDPETAWSERQLAPVCVCLRHDAHVIEIRHTCETPALHYVWQRRVSLEGEVCRIHDHVQASQPVQIRLHLHLSARNVGLETGGQCAVVPLAGGDARLRLCTDGVHFVVHDRLAQAPDNHWTRSPELTAVQTGSEASFTWEIA